TINRRGIDFYLRNGNTIIFKTINKRGIDFYLRNGNTIIFKAKDFQNWTNLTWVQMVHLLEFLEVLIRSVVAGILSTLLTSGLPRLPELASKGGGIGSMVPDMIGS
nr:hypothetical protein [Tanacetum cinerariifolium]